MKTDREKLEHAICWGLQESDLCMGGCYGVCPQVDTITDYLISKGVTIPVRCGECIYMEEAYEKNGFLICPASGMEIMNTDFCSYGERIEE